MEIAPLLAMRGFPLSRSGGEMHWRIPGEESVSIRGNMWYSHYRGEGGDAISFARRFFHMDFKEAVRFLLEQSAAPAAGPVQCERQEQKQLRLPPKDSSEEQVRRYLTGIRKVSADVAGYFIETGQVYQSRAEGVRQGQEQCSLVLVGMDRDGAPRQAHIKGMRQRAFRYDAPGSDKAYGFRHMGGSGPLYVFEAAVDLMSYVSLYPKDWRQGNYLALNGTAEAALFRTLEEYPEVRGVVLALDNDAGGIEGVMRLTGLLREKGYTDVSVQLPAWKDWNEELKARGGMDAVCAQPHPKLQMLEQVKDAVLARAVHAPRFVDGRYLEGTFQAACSAQADEIQNSCLQKLAAVASCPVQPETVASCRTFGEWLLLPLLCRPEAQPLRELAGVALERLYEGDTAPWQVFCHDSEEFRARPRPAASLETEEGVETFDPALLEFVYPYQRETLLPAKVTATQLKGRPLDEEISQNAHHTPYLRPLSQPRFRQERQGLTAAEQGTATHLVLQYLDFSDLDVADQVESLCLRGLLTDEQAAAVDREALERFLRSPLAEEIRRGQNVRREYPFTLLMDARDYDPDAAAGETILLQGVVDCCFETEDGITVVDFKTDRVLTDAEVRRRAEQYRPQLEAYSRALERVLERPVVRRELYFLRAGTSIAL